GQFLRGKLFNIHTDLPLVSARGHASAELVGQHAWGQALWEEAEESSGARWTQVPGPVAARPAEELPGQDWHSKRLVKDPAAVPVVEGVPARLAQQCEGNLFLSHTSAWNTLATA
uniref:Uncharacterized protein n=1 Tax=Astyanax mexicanus TaxID=7994 RepID=A0A8B9LJT1_ASTMX